MGDGAILLFLELQEWPVVLSSDNNNIAGRPIGFESLSTVLGGMRNPARLALKKPVK